MSFSHWQTKLGPAPIVDALRRRTATAFSAEVAGAPLLLVRVGQDDELAAVLEATMAAESGQPAEPLVKLDFHTEVVTGARLIAATMDAPGDSRAAEELAVALRLDVHYVVPVGKRRGAASAFADRISVGRAPNTDIVLRHKSVSKYHAYFSAYEDGGHVLVDAGSKNGTKVNGELIEPRVGVALSEGDTIRFGSVEATFVAPETLWHAARR